MKGELNGKICGCSVRRKDSFYCSKHKPYERRELLKKKKHDIQEIKEEVKEYVKDDVKKVEKKEEEVKQDKNKDEKKPKKTVIRLNPVVNKFVHSLTGLVFFSKTEQVIYAKLNKDNELCRLTESDIQLCKQYLFKYDLTKF
jgi:hypothetical protein